MSKLKCIIHYKHLGDSNEEITTLNEGTFKKLRDSAEARRTLGGEFIHYEQIDNLPESRNAQFPPRVLSEIHKCCVRFKSSKYSGGLIRLPSYN